MQNERWRQCKLPANESDQHEHYSCLQHGQRVRLRASQKTQHLSALQGLCRAQHECLKEGPTLGLGCDHCYQEEDGYLLVLQPHLLLSRAWHPGSALLQWILQLWSFHLLLRKGWPLSTALYPHASVQAYGDLRVGMLHDPPIRLRAKRLALYETWPTLCEYTTVKDLVLVCIPVPAADPISVLDLPIWVKEDLLPLHPSGRLHNTQVGCPLPDLQEG